jgi:hypothetical protein
MSNEGFNEPPKKTGESPLILLPTGQMASLDQLLAREGQEHVEVDVAQMKPGDLVIADYANMSGADNDNRPGRFNIKFEDSQWAHLGIAQENGPTKHWIVEVNGLPQKKPRPYRAAYIGAGWGGSMISPNTLATDRSLAFNTPDGELHSPFIKKFVIVRQAPEAETNIQRLVKPKELASGDENIRAVHEERLGQYALLMEKFAFAKKYDFRNGNESPFLKEFGTQENADYEDGEFAAMYYAGMAMGNSLIIFNKKDRTYIHYNYYNFKDKDALQIGYSDLEGTGQPFNPHEFGRLVLGASMAHRSGSSITTYNTSPKISLDAINYHVSDSDAKNLLQIPLYKSWKEVTAPELQIQPDGSFRIPERYPINMLLEQDPQIFEKIKSRIVIEKVDEVTTVILGGEKRRLRTPQEIFSSIST